MVSIYAPRTMTDEFFDSVLQPDELAYTDHIRYLSHLVITRQFVDERCRDRGAATLKSEYLHNVIGRREWKTVKGICQRHDLVTTNGSYVPGERSCAYRLGEAHNGKWHRVGLTDRALAARWSRWRDRDDAEFWQAATKLSRFRILKRMMKNRDRLTLDRVNVRQLCLDHEAQSREAHGWKEYFNETSEPFDLEKLIRWREMAAEKLWDGEWWKRLCPYGRYYWNVSGLWRHLRPYLRYDGQPMVNIDVKCSQPLFFVLLMMGEMDRFSSFSPILTSPISLSSSLSSLMIENGPPGPSLPPYIALTYDDAWGRLKPDIQGFITQVVNPDCDIYEHLGRLAGCADDPRTPVKKKSTFHILYGTNKKTTPYQTAMDTHYPNVMAFIKAYKERHGYESLAQEMQRQESTWMFNQVCKRLTTEHPEIPLFPIHDSLMTLPEHAETVKRTMEEELFRLGVKPQLNVEDYTR